MGSPRRRCLPGMISTLGQGIPTQHKKTFASCPGALSGHLSVPSARTLLMFPSYGLNLKSASHPRPVFVSRLVAWFLFVHFVREALEALGVVCGGEELVGESMPLGAFEGDSQLPWSAVTWTASTTCSTATP